MKKISYDEFSKRVNAVNKAARIFKPLTDNVSEAFNIYQQVLAEEEELMAVMVSTKEFGSEPVRPLDDFERPQCPECSSWLYLKNGAIDDNGKRWATAWSCQKCKAEFYSEKTTSEWMSELKKNVPE